MTQSTISQRLAEDLAIIRSWSNNGRGVPYPEIDTVNIGIGDGANVLVPGIAGAIRADFNCIITGAYAHEYDGITGSVSISIDKSQYVAGSSPSFAVITGSSPIVISNDRYGEDETLAGWTTQIARGDVLRFIVNSATSIQRVLITLRIRRLEP